MSIIGVRWTEEEDRQLRQSVGVLTAKEIAAMMNGRTHHAVVKRASKLGLSLNKCVLITEQEISSFRINGWSVCREKENCVHPNAGNLTKDDYYKMKGALDGRNYICKKCYMAKMKKNQKKIGRNYLVCRSVKCENPKNGELSKDDYYTTDRLNSDGERGRTAKCKHCLDRDIKSRPKDKSTCLNDDCDNPNNGQLAEKDYERYSARRLSKLCKHCLEKKRLAENTEEINLDFSEIINSSPIQQWLCGQMPC